MAVGSHRCRHPVRDGRLPADGTPECSFGGVAAHARGAAQAPWLASLGLADVDWPMAGVPATLHLDNAAEFKSKALRSGCREYGIELTYRPPHRPQFGGHVERMNRTLMERLRGLPGATVPSKPGGRRRLLLQRRRRS